MPDFCQGNAYNGIGSGMNQEIDIETPTYAYLEGGGDGNCSNASWNNARFNTYSHSDHTPVANFSAIRAASGQVTDLADGKFHVYRFDWKTKEVKIPSSDSWGDEAGGSFEELRRVRTDGRKKQENTFVVIFTHPPPPPRPPSRLVCVLCPQRLCR